MDRRVVALSNLPSFMMPCPCCGGRMLHQAAAPAAMAGSFEDITHACKRCGAELTRTVRRGAPHHPGDPRLRAAGG